MFKALFNTRVLQAGKAVALGVGSLFLGLLVLGLVFPHSSALLVAQFGFSVGLATLIAQMIADGSISLVLFLQPELAPVIASLITVVAVFGVDAVIEV